MAQDRPVIAHVSVDTLYFSSSGALKPGVEGVLETYRSAADEAGGPVESPWEFDGLRLMLRHYGWYGFAFWLSCEAFDLMISTNERLPAGFVQVRQVYLYEVGDPLMCYRHIVEWLQAELLDIDETTIARLDLCADIIGFPADQLDLDLYTTRAREAHMRTESRRITGLEWGVRGSPCYVRLYDKTLEAFVHRKTWMDRLWLPHGWDPGERETVADKDGEPKRNPDGSVKTKWKREPERVFRLEYELRGEFFDRFALDNDLKAMKRPEDVLENAGHIWEYLTGRWQVDDRRQKTWVAWLTLRTPSATANRSRWPPPAWWEAMARDGLKQARMGDVVRRQIDTITAETLLRQAAGCVAQIAAIYGDTSIDEAVRNFRIEWERLLQDKGTTYEQVVEAKAQRYQAARRPLEKAATAALKKPKEEK